MEESKGRLVSRVYISVEIDDIVYKFRSKMKVGNCKGLVMEIGDEVTVKYYVNSGESNHTKPEEV